MPVSLPSPKTMATAWPSDFVERVHCRRDIRKHCSSKMSQPKSVTDWLVHCAIAHGAGPVSDKWMPFSLVNLADPKVAMVYGIMGYGIAGGLYTESTMPTLIRSIISLISVGSLVSYVALRLKGERQAATLVVSGMTLAYKLCQLGNATSMEVDEYAQHLTMVHHNFMRYIPFIASSVGYFVGAQLLSPRLRGVCVALESLAYGISYARTGQTWIVTELYPMSFAFPVGGLLAVYRCVTSRSREPSDEKVKLLCSLPPSAPGTPSLPHGDGFDATSEVQQLPEGIDVLRQFQQAVSEGQLNTVGWYLHTYGSIVLLAPLRRAELADAWQGVTPMHVASFYGQVEVAKLLHMHGASLTDASDAGLMPMHYACIGGSLPFAQWLHANNVSVTVPTEQNASSQQPLHLACGANAPALVAWLLERGADPNAIDAFRHKPADYALAYGAPDCIPLLVQSGATLGYYTWFVWRCFAR